MREQWNHEQLLAGSLIDGLSSIVAAAHELKSPLALIRQLSLIIEDGGLADHETIRLLKQITLTSERALRLTSDLTRCVNMNDALFNLEPINPVQLCEDVVSELTPFFVANDRIIRLVDRKHHLLLVGNRDLLRRVIMNFSDNALHYSDDKTAIEINIEATDNGEFVRLGVRDYGPAVSMDVLKSLSGKLAASSATVHARPNSSGLGLYIASQFAGLMNGKLGVTRHRDGATFYIDLQSSRQLSLL